ncbi:hypothetical protein WCWAEYFT_CDS0111 [Vibrio phage VB_VaC_TDDLMA]
MNPFIYKGKIDDRPFSLYSTDNYISFYIVDGNRLSFSLKGTFRLRIKDLLELDVNNCPYNFNFDYHEYTQKRIKDKELKKVAELQSFHDLKSLPETHPELFI